METIRTPPEFQWWKPEASDPAQFELQIPHWAPDFEFQDWQQAAESAETSVSWQATELNLNATAIPRERTIGREASPQSLSETKD